MCTLIALHRCVPGLSLVIAANRDEYLDRPSEGPALRPGPAGPLVAPRDVREGGTWLGVNGTGLFAGVTNRPAPAPDPGRRSRGLLVLDALGAGSAAQAARALEALPVGAYNPFNLLVADGEDAFVATYREEVKVRALQPGVHVIGNADPGERAVPKLARLLADAERAAAAGADGVLDALAALCRRHVGCENPLEETCIHTPLYGTRSSTLLAVGGGRSSLRYADGPPCGSDYEDFTPLLRQLAESDL